MTKPETFHRECCAVCGEQFTTSADDITRHIPTAEEEAAAKLDETVIYRPPHPDTVRLNWLEHMARNGGIFLYNGVDVDAEKRTAVGLGLRPGLVNRSLREAIDSANPSAPVAGSGE